MTDQDHETGRDDSQPTTKAPRRTEPLASAPRKDKEFGSRDPEPRRPSTLEEE